MTSPDQQGLFDVQGPVVTPKEVDHRALSIRLYNALKAVLSHEGCGRWTQAGFTKSQRLGCQFCANEWINHAPDCLYLRAQRFVESVEEHFKRV